MARPRDDAPTSCVNCGYDLQGLPLQGRCPECGQPFDIASGRGLKSPLSERAERGDRVVLWFKVGSLAGLAVAILLIGAMMALRSPLPARPLSIAGILAACLGFAAAVTWWTEKD